jgi:hypothetical protein
LKDDSSFHNSRKDENQSTDIQSGQIVDNVGISESSLELKHVNMKYLGVV